MAERKRAQREAEVEALLRWYPRIFFACHQRHVRDPSTGELLSAHQASILDHLDLVDPTALTDLARHMGVTAGTMSVGIERLVRRGYVQRGRAPEDQRRAELRLTDAGVRMRNQQSVLEPARVEELLEQLNDAERAEALAGLQLLARAANDLIASKQTSRQVR